MALLFYGRAYEAAGAFLKRAFKYHSKVSRRLQQILSILAKVKRAGAYISKHVLH
jgi:hypothetical protein